MGYVLASGDRNLPEWLAGHLNNTCACGYPKENGYNDKGKCTSRRCTNPDCPYMMAEKIGAMCSILGISNIKSGVGLRMIKEHQLENHFQALHLISKEKYRVTISQLLRLNFIPGVDTGWDNECYQYSSVEELFHNYRGNLRNLLYTYEKQIRDSESYFDITPYKKPALDAVFSGCVTLSGSFEGLRDRKAFISCMNASLQGLVNIKVVDSPSRKVIAHIQEASAAHRTKYAYAVANHIPIYTPKEFLQYITALIKERTT